MIGWQAGGLAGWLCGTAGIPAGVWRGSGRGPAPLLHPAPPLSPTCLPLEASGEEAGAGCIASSPNTGNSFRTTHYLRAEERGEVAVGRLDTELQNILVKEKVIVCQRKYGSCLPHPSPPRQVDKLSFVTCNRRERAQRGLG